MLNRILALVLETAFFLLIASALLRAWMNWLRVNMSAQPGRFAMALTDWLVKPLRRVLPKALAQSRVDWASIVAATLMALGYALLWWGLFGLLLGVAGVGMGGMGGMGFGLGALMLLGLLGFALQMLLRVALQTLLILVLGYAVLSWVQPGSPVGSLLGRLTEPLLAPLRRVIPVVGGVDLSALVLILLLQIGMMLV